MISCAITTSLLGCFITLFLFARHIYFLELPFWADICCVAAMLIIGCFPLLSEYNFEKCLGTAYPIYRYTLYFVFVGSIIFFTLTIISDVFAFASLKMGLIKNMPTGIYSLCILAVSALCSFYALYAGIKIPDVKSINLYSDKITEAKKIVLLSDIHIHRVINPEKVKGIVDAANKLNPDIILLDGDIIDDDVEKVHNISLLLQELKAKEGIYFVTGNHEFYTGYKQSVQELKSFGFKFLENDGVSLGNIYLAGIPDVFSGANFGRTANIEEAFAFADNNQFKILMSHTPTDFHAGNNFDLELSGHTHGGQIFPFHILTKIHNKYLAGMYDMENDAKIYVTSGSGQWGPQMRFLAPSEITLINILPEGNKNMKKADIDTVFAQGEPNPYGKFFTGQTYLTRLSANDTTWNSSLANVTFEPRARTNWHKHSGGQILLVLGGEGRYQERGGEIRILHKGDVVRIPLNVEHWHGAAPDSWFTHISVETNLPDNQTTWLEPVTDAEYK